MYMDNPNTWNLNAKKKSTLLEEPPYVDLS